MAIGAPEPRDQLLVFSPRDTTGAGAFPRQDEVRFYFADDRRNEGEFWLLSDAGAAASIGPQTGPDHDRPPGLYGATRRGYEAARRARFEHCEIGSASVHLSPPDAGAELLSQPVSKETLEAYTRWKYPGLPADEKIQRLLLRDLDKDRYKTLGDLDRVVNSASDAVDHYKVEKPEWFTAGTDYLTKSLGFGDHHFRERHPFAPRTREAFVKYGHLVKSETSEPPLSLPFTVTVDGKAERERLHSWKEVDAMVRSHARQHPGSTVQAFDRYGREVIFCPRGTNGWLRGAS
jgi:hypothetical protein